MAGEHPVGRSLFCPECGKPRHDLKDVAGRVMGGIGVNSSSHRVQAFLDSGDPADLSGP